MLKFGKIRVRRPRKKMEDRVRELAEITRKTDQTLRQRSRQKIMEILDRDYNCRRREAQNLLLKKKKKF